jgi:hypothetical protein
LSHLNEARKVAELLHLDATLKAHDGDIDGALTSALAALNAGRAIGDEPLVVSQLFRLVCLNRALLGIERALGQGAASASVLKDVQQALEEEAETPLLLIALRGERASLHQTLLEFKEGKFDRRAWGLRNPAFMPDGVMNLVDANKASDTHPATIRYLNELVEIAKRPAEEQRPAFAGMARPNLDYPTLLMIFSNGDPVKPVPTFHTSLARLRCASVALAVERFRVAEGRWPTTLNELTPAWLKSVPLDPMDGAPLRYIASADGVVIYSVSLDETDNQGNLSRSNSPPVDRDVGFRLWDPERRRQTTSETP